MTMTLIFEAFGSYEWRLVTIIEVAYCKSSYELDSFLITSPSFSPESPPACLPAKSLGANVTRISYQYSSSLQTAMFVVALPNNTVTIGTLQHKNLYPRSAQLFFFFRFFHFSIIALFRLG